MGHNQEHLDVTNYEIHLLADDNAPDAEAPYFVWRIKVVISSLQAAEALGRHLAKKYRICGFEVYNFPVMNNYKPRRVSGYFGDFEDEVCTEYL
jgi:hypothetical protein